MSARLRGMGCVVGGAAWLVAACGGTEHGTPPREAGEGDLPVEAAGRDASPGDGLQLGGGQTTDFGDGVNSPCEFTVETVSRDVARAEGWPVDADLALLQPLVDVELQRESGRCELEPAGALRIQSDLVAIRLARGTPVPELVGRVECPPMLSYAIDVALDADNGWIKGLFHAEFLAGGSELYGSAFEPAESLQGELALRVDGDRPHLARANLALWFTRSLVRGELALVVYYSDRLEPMLDTGERLTWPSYPGASCTDSAPLEPGSEWLSLDGHNAPAQP